MKKGGFKKKGNLLNISSGFASSSGFKDAPKEKSNLKKGFSPESTSFDTFHLLAYSGRSKLSHSRFAKNLSAKKNFATKTR